MASAQPLPASHLVWERTTVDGRTALYGVAGEGLPVVFVHGWALSQHAYKRALKRLVEMGCKVYAPALPGFGGSADLPGAQCTLPGYAAWLDGFLSAVGVDEPAFIVGHSFGGGVAIQLAHDFPARTRTLVLVNSIGGAVPGRPIWDWGLHFPGAVGGVLPVVLEDAVPNLIRNPRALWRVGHLARRADLTGELEELKRRGLPVVVLWGEQDRIVPRTSFDALCKAIGSDGEVVTGNHSWLLSDPDAFAEVMTNLVAVAKVVGKMKGEPAKKRLPRRIRKAKAGAGAAGADLRSVGPRGDG